MFQLGWLKNLRQLASTGTSQPMTSVFPTVSSVAWTTCTTGCNPGRHGIFGFLDRKPDTMELFIPTAKDCCQMNIWTVLKQNGLNSVSINLPLTYPPASDGIQISGFLCTDLSKCVWPKRLLPQLFRCNYIIDVDTALARENLDEFYQSLHRAIDARFDIAEWIWHREPWDYFHLHIMESDRFFHFFMQEDDKDISGWDRLRDLYEHLDHRMSWIINQVAQGDLVFILSDHGFCPLRSEVNLNEFLHSRGYLYPGSAPSEGLSNIRSDSLVYSLTPGRIYLNQMGREKYGRVMPGEESDRILMTLKDELLNLRGPYGEQVIAEVRYKNQLYQGEKTSMAPDAIAIPCDGFDLKGNFGIQPLWDKQTMKGMHTYNNATFICSEGLSSDRCINLLDFFPTALDHLGITLLTESEGRSLKRSLNE